MSQTPIGKLGKYEIRKELQQKTAIAPTRSIVPSKTEYTAPGGQDDGEVKRVRAYFRAEGREFFYWSEMVFDGIQYCATLPVAKKNVKGVEYYIWAVDDSFQSKRTRTYKMSLVPEAPCEYPVFDDDRERSSNLVINATSPKQGSSVSDFIEKGDHPLYPGREDEVGSLLIARGAPTHNA